MDMPSSPKNHEQRCEEKLAAAILQYLTEHPHAMDTLEGIAEWWIGREQIRVEVNTLAKVLHRMTEQGLLEASGTGMSTRYSLKSTQPAT
jgi:DNA-binding IclR family transcriptional regulator